MCLHADGTLVVWQGCRHRCSADGTLVVWQGCCHCFWTVVIISKPAANPCLLALNDALRIYINHCSCIHTHTNFNLIIINGGCWHFYHFHQCNALYSLWDKPLQFLLQGPCVFCISKFQEKPSWKCQRLCNKYNLCSHASLAYMGKSRPQARDKVLPSRESQRIMFGFKTLSAWDDHSWVLRRKTNWESAIKKSKC